MKGQAASRLHTPEPAGKQEAQKPTVWFSLGPDSMIHPTHAWPTLSEQQH